MAASRHEVTSQDGTLIPVWTSGSGRPLLIIHGATTNHHQWDAVAEHLNPHLRVVAMDRRCTMGDPLARYDMEREFEDVAAVAATLGDEVDIFGHSSGALCALGASLQTPNLRRLILYEPPLEGDPRLPPIVQRLWERLRAGDIDGVLDGWLKEYVGIPDEPAEGLKASPIGADIRPWAQYLPREMSAHLAYEWRPQTFASLAAPTLYLAGQGSSGNEQLFGFVRILEGVIQDFTVREIPGQGHFANFLAPDLLARMILEFVEPAATPSK